MAKRSGVRISIKTKMLIGFVLIALLSSITVGGIIFKEMSAYEMDQLKNELQILVNLAAADIDADVHAGLQPGDEQKEEYTELLAKLRAFKETSGLTFICTYIPYDENSVKFVIDTDESEEQGKIGDLYPSEGTGEQVDRDLLGAFHGEATINEIPREDEYGIFLSAYAPLKNANGDVIAVVGADFSVDGLEKMQQRILILIGTGVLISIIVSIAVALYLASRISRPVGLMVHELDDVVRNSGDLTQSITIKTGDEIELLAEKTNELLANIRQIIHKIRETAGYVNHNTIEITSAIEQASGTIDHVNHTINDIVIGASQQSEIVNDSSRKIERLSQQINILSENSSEISKSTGDARNYTRESTNAMNDLQQKFKMSEEIVAAVFTTTKKLEEKSEEIVKIINVITGISEQTNLLALNAAIEAARAGEQGRGFAVVADEIRKLAENTTLSAKEITAHIIEVRNQSVDTAEAMNKIVGTIASQSEAIKNTGDRLMRIADTVAGISENTANIDAAIKNVYIEKEEVLTRIYDIRTDSEKMVAATEEVNAASQEQQAVIESIADSVQHLKNMAAELEDTVKKFKI